MAARASAKAAFTALLASFASASSMTGSAFSSCDLKTDCAAAMRLAGSGDSSVRLPNAAATERRKRLLRRTASAPSGSLSTAAPVAASTDLAIGVGDEDLLGLGIGRQTAVLKRADDGKGPRIAGSRDNTNRLFGIRKLVVGELGDRILESAGKRRQAQTDNEKSGKSERTKSLEEMTDHFTTPAGVTGKAAASPPSPVSWIDLANGDQDQDP